MKKYEHGDCFEANAKYIIDLITNNNPMKENVFLCHGKVIGSPGTKIEGKIIDHCWIELQNDIFIDKSNGRTITQRLDAVAKNIISESVIRYTPDEVIELLIATENYGPWE